MRSPRPCSTSLRREEDETVRRFAASTVADQPHIACWRDAYRAFGAKPKDHPSSIENLVRRAVKGQRLRSVNRLVDLYNTISLRHLEVIYKDRRGALPPLELEGGRSDQVDGLVQKHCGGSVRTGILDRGSGLAFRL